MSDEINKLPRKKAPIKAPAAVAPVAPVSTSSSTAAIAAATAEPVADVIVAPVVETVSEPAPVAAPATPMPEIAAPQKGPTMTDTATNFTADATSKAQAVFSDLNARTKQAVERSTKLFEEMNEFNKGNIEALVESSRVAAKAAETLSQHAAETARKNFEQATAAMKSMAAVKSPTELFQLQSDLARKSFDEMIAEASKTSETMLKLAGDIFQPLSNRFAVAADKMKVAA
jgi:phasin family protein